MSVCMCVRQKEMFLKELQVFYSKSLTHTHTRVCTYIHNILVVIEP